MVYGYIRVSTEAQNLARQYDSMYKAGLTDEFIFADKKSGKNFERPAYEKLMETVKEGDVILFHSLDRMGRSYKELSEQWFIITHQKKVDIKVLDMPLLDTTNNNDTVIGNLIADIVFKLLCYLAEVERENTMKRQEEGIRAAKARGVKFGRKPMEKPEGYEECKRLFDKGDMSYKEGGRRLKVSPNTFKKWVLSDIKSEEDTETEENKEDRDNNHNKQSNNHNNQETNNNNPENNHNNQGDNKNNQENNPNNRENKEK